jgi:hypothetical protein
VPTLATILDSSLDGRPRTLLRIFRCGCLGERRSTLGGAPLVTVTARSDASANASARQLSHWLNRVDALDTSYQLTGEMAGVRAVAPCGAGLPLPFG